MQPGARIKVFGDYEMLLEDWGGSATAIGPSIDGLQALIDRLKIGLDQFSLNDLRDEEFARSVAFANALFCENVRAEQFVPGFVIGSLSDAEVEKFRAQSVHIEMPIGMNLLSHGIVIWIEAEGTCYLDGDGKLAGLRLSRQVGERVELHTKFAKSIYPEIWINESVPALKIGSEGATVSTFKREGDPPIPFTT